MINARRLLACAAGYLLCVAVLHGSVLAHLGTRVLGGAFVGGIFVWETSWFSHCLRASVNPFFTRQLMYPMGVPVVVESPWNALLGVLLSFWTGPYRAVNVLFLGNYVLSGVAMAALALELTDDGAASFVAGFFFMFCQYALAEHILGHLHESTIYPLPLLFLGVLRLFKGRRGSWVLVTAGLALTCLSSAYLMLEGVLIGLPVFLFLARRELAGPRWGVAWRQMAASAAAVAALTAFAYLPVWLRRRDFVGGDGFFSLSVLSFFDFPAWHPSPWIQALRLHTAGLVNPAAIDPARPDRTDFAFRSQPENLLGFFGLTLPALLAVGWKRGALRRRGPWLGLAAAGAVLALGPRLQWAYAGGRLPLPYALLELAGPLRAFRAPARMIVLSWVGLCALAGCSFAAWTRDWKPGTRAACAAAVLLSFSWEMGLSVLGRQCAAAEPSGVFARLRQDPAPGAVLELPVSISGSGEVSVNSEAFMLREPLYGRPLVVGRPVRYTDDSLDFCMTKPLAFELTHPPALEALYAAKPSPARLRALARAGRAAFAKAGVRFVLLHTRDGFISALDRRLDSELLRASLGAPVEADPDGSLLFEVR